jgi:S-formylglutathione hydrolase FrmB
MGEGSRLRRAAVVAVALAVACPGVARANQLIEITLAARHYEVADKWLPGYPGPPRAKVLLPDGYDPAKAYPLLILLSGLNSDYSYWAAGGQIAKTAKDVDAIIVMPEGGDGWYADWWNGGRRGDPSWESYHLDEVIPQIEERYRIRPERRWHAIGGFSMGGLGAAYLGGRLPGFFGSIVVISGLMDLHLVPGEGAVQAGVGQLKTGTTPDPEAVEGPAGGFYEVGHNPVRLSANLTHTRVFMSAGDGTPEPDSASDPVNEVAGAAAEGGAIHPSSTKYATALAAAGVDYVYQQHPGHHDWPNFIREFRAAAAWGIFKPVDEHPTSWVNDTVATHGKLWEFAYRFDSPPAQVVRFRRSGDQLRISAAGSPVTITTDGGCTFHLATPAEIHVPARPCSRFGLSVTPRVVRAGRPSRVTVQLTPALAGARVTLGDRSVPTDARGRARLRVCLPSRARRRVVVQAMNYLPATAVVRSRGRRGSCARTQA